MNAIALVTHKEWHGDSPRAKSLASFTVCPSLSIGIWRRDVRFGKLSISITPVGVETLKLPL